MTDNEFRGETRATLKAIQNDIIEIKEMLQRIEAKADENAKAIAGLKGASRVIYVAAGIIAAIISAAMQAVAALVKK